MKCDRSFKRDLMIADVLAEHQSLTDIFVGLGASRQLASQLAYDVVTKRKSLDAARASLAKAKV